MLQSNEFEKLKVDELPLTSKPSTKDVKNEDRDQE